MKKLAKRSQPTPKRMKKRAPEPLALQDDESVEPLSYRDGGEGMIKWVNDHVCAPIYPEGSDIAVWTPMGELPSDLNPDTGRSYDWMWSEQQRILKQALAMKDSRFKYRQLVFCWPRGEGKSFVACLIQLWKFFCWPRQQIMLGANSKDQVKFVHYDILRDLILNSPKLIDMIGGKKNVQEKEIRLKDDRGVVRSLIRSISSFSGIVSNITGYTFSEIFDMKKPKFYVQLDGSIRTMPNALGVIDSTVSAKDHVLYDLYTGFTNGKLKQTYFSYRYSATGHVDDYWNPYMDADQLSDYQIKFPFGEFERYFQNLWSAGTVRAFTEAMVEEMGYIGMNGEMLNHKPMQDAIREKAEKMEVLGDLKSRGINAEETALKITDINSRFKQVDSLYPLLGPFERTGMPQPVTLEQLQMLGDLFDTEWALLAGVDLADPMAVRGIARSMLTIVAKGLPGSRSSSHLIHAFEAAPKYLYFLIFLMDNSTHSNDILKEALEYINDSLDGIDTICCERYGAWDLTGWCDDRQIKYEPIFPTYARQREAFKEFFISMSEGRFKAPVVPVMGTTQEDVLREEMSVFDHDHELKWFGSPEKYDRHGIQDDSIYSIGWSLFGGRELGADDFRVRKVGYNFGHMFQGAGVMGRY